MANYAFVENGNITGVYDLLPLNWQNISNFQAMAGDEVALKNLGWYVIQKVLPDYDSETQKLDLPKHYIQDDVVYETLEVIDLAPPMPGPTAEELLAQAWSDLRSRRDQYIADFDWRISRYNREMLLGITPTSDDILAMQTYIQALAELPQNTVDPFAVAWPVYTG